jgi:hypothetical protein
MWEGRDVALIVACGDVGVRLREEAEQLGEQVLLLLGQLGVPVVDVLLQRNLIRQPVHLLSGMVGFERPRIHEGLVVFALFGEH